MLTHRLAQFTVETGCLSGLEIGDGFDVIALNSIIKRFVR